MWNHIILVSFVCTSTFLDGIQHRIFKGELVIFFFFGSGVTDAGQDLVHGRQGSTSLAQSQVFASFRPPAVILVGYTNFIFFFLTETSKLDTLIYSLHGKNLKNAAISPHLLKNSSHWMMIPMGCLSLCISQRWSLERDHCLDFFFGWCTSLLLVGKPCLISHRDGSCLSICPSPLQNMSTERFRIILTPFIVLTNCLF